MSGSLLSNVDASIICLILFSLCWSHLRWEIICGSDFGKPEKEIPGAVLIRCTIDPARPLDRLIKPYTKQQTIAGLRKFF